MKHNELRIGNWINGKEPYSSESKNFQVRSISEKGINCLADNRQGDSYAENIEPIKFTKEWFKLFGFESRQTNQPNLIEFTLWNGKDTPQEIVILWDGHVFVMMRNLKQIAKSESIYYVHKFQNWFYFNSNYELYHHEIK